MERETSTLDSKVSYKVRDKAGYFTPMDVAYSPDADSIVATYWQYDGLECIDRLTGQSKWCTPRTNYKRSGFAVSAQQLDVHKGHIYVSPAALQLWTMDGVWKANLLPKNNIWDVAVDDIGIVCTTFSGEVLTLSHSGQRVRSWDLAQEAFTVAVYDNYVAVTERNGSSIALFSRDGCLIRRWRSTEAAGVAMNNDTICISDTHNQLVFFSLEGKKTRCIQKGGTYLTHMSKPAGLTFVSPTEILAADTANHQIELLNLSKIQVESVLVKASAPTTK